MIILFLMSIGWPLAPQDSTHAIGNNWGEFQDYGGSPYCHPGIDVMGITVGKPVYAVHKGVVKAWLTTQADWHWRLAIADTNISVDSVEAWLYAHIDPYQYHKNVGDLVNQGELIGYLVEWPVIGFDHCHFARIKDIGAVWNNADWAFIENALLLIAPYADTAKPVFDNAVTGQKFAICQNNTSTYLNPNNVSGSIDIIAKIYDRTGLPIVAYPTWEKLIPFRITYEIHGPQNVPNRLSFVFRGYFNYDTYITTIYKDDITCNSQGDYDVREYYFIVTNTDGDSLVEAGDVSYSWNTAGFPGGQYWIVVTAYDAAGNFKKDSMMVTIPNPGIEENETAVLDNSTIMANPSHNRMIVLSDDIKLYDINGRILSRASISALPAGVYFMVYRENNRLHHNKIVIVK